MIYEKIELSFIHALIFLSLNYILGALWAMNTIQVAREHILKILEEHKNAGNKNFLVSCMNNLRRLRT